MLKHIPHTTSCGGAEAFKEETVNGKVHIPLFCIVSTSLYPPSGLRMACSLSINLFVGLSDSSLFAISCILTQLEIFSKIAADLLILDVKKGILIGAHLDTFPALFKVF